MPMPTKRRAQAPLLDRAVAFSPATFDADTGRVRVVFTTGERVLRGGMFEEEPFWEELSMERGAIRARRLESGRMAFLVHHFADAAGQLGVVDPEWELREGEPGEGEAAAWVRLSQAPEFKRYRDDIQAGILANVSQRYRVYVYERRPNAPDGRAVLRAVDWEPMHVALEPNPADPKAGIRAADAAAFEVEIRDREDTQMEIDPRTGRPFTDRAEEARWVALRAAARAAGLDDTFARSLLDNGTTADAARQACRAEVDRRASGGEGEGTPAPATPPAEGTPPPATPPPPADPPAPGGAPSPEVTAERQRAEIIMGLCQQFGMPDQLRSELVRSGASEAQARVRIMNRLADGQDGGPAANRSGGTSTSSVHGVLDEQAKLRDTLVAAMLHRVDPAAHQLPDGAREFAGMPLLRLSEWFAGRNGIRSAQFNSADVLTRAGYMLTGYWPGQRDVAGLHGVSDFPNILANVANKRLARAFSESPRTFAPIAYQNTAPDFKNITIVKMGESPDLEAVGAQGEFKYGTIGEAGQTYALSTYGKIIGFTRQAIINDDLRAFDRVVAGFGRAAARLESDLVWALITGNVTMYDTVALFHANHANTTAGDMDTVANAQAALKVMEQQMRLQKGLDGTTELSLYPEWLIVPPAFAMIARMLLTSTTPSQASEVNPWAGILRGPIVEPRLTATEAYICAGTGQVDGLEYCYLQGNSGPFVETRQGFTIDGVETKVRHDFAATMTEWRGWQRMT